MGKFIYFPVSPEMGFWNEKEYGFKYPYAFLSVYYGLKEENWRKQKNVDDDVIVMADSGGFQITTQKVNIDPLDIVEWYNKNADIGMMLDYPPFAGERKAQIVNFYENLEMSVQASKIIYDNAKIPVYGVIHGVNDKQKMDWKNAIDMIGDWDGYAFSVAPTDNVNQILQIIQFIVKNNIDKPVHFLATTSFFNILLLSRFSRFHSNVVSVDSATSFKMLSGMEYITVFNRRICVGDVSEKRVEKTPVCFCPICKKHIPNGQGKMNKETLRLHNLYMYIWKVLFLESIAGSSYKALGLLFDESKIEKIKALDKIIGVRKGESLEQYF